MDLRNKEITLGELWDNPKSRSVFQKRVPMMKNHPVKNRARTVTLGQLEDFLSTWLPGPLIQSVLSDLERL